MRSLFLRGESAVKDIEKKSVVYITVFLKWIIIGITIGALGGVIGAAFHELVTWALDFRAQHGFIVWLLPIGGLVIALLYKLAGITVSVNDILKVVRSSEKIPLLTAPLIFVGTVITQLFGGSAGKEGAAIQMGGTIGYQTARLFKADVKDSHVFVMCGMSAVFSAVFGTPVTAAIFALEVISIGQFYYVALLPCFVSAVTGIGIAKLLGSEFTVMPRFAVPEFSFSGIALTVLLAALCAVVSMVFCVSLHGGEKLMKKYIKSSLLRVVIGGAAVALLTFAVGNNDYNGAGMDIVVRAVSGEAVPYAFALKLIFTVITISAGFKGGEIVPSMFIGATLGCSFGALTGLEPGFCAALGLVAFFCGMVNCPLASIFLGLELFGGDALLYFVMASGVGFLLSGNFGLYRSQKLMYSKLKAEFININTK